MANEELQSFTDRLDQLFRRRATKQSDYLQTLGERLEFALEESINVVGNAVSRVEEAVRRGVQGQNVTIEGISPPEPEVGIQQDVVTRRMIEAARTFESAARQQTGAQQGRENIERSIEASIQEEDLADIEEAVNVESESITAGWTEQVQNFFQGALERFRSIFSEDVIEGAFEPAREAVPAGQTQAVVPEGAEENVEQINRLFRELSSHTEVSEERVQQTASQFQELSSRIVEIQEEVIEGQVSVEEAHSRVEEITANIEGQFESIFGDELENAEVVVDRLRQLAGDFAANMREAAENVQQVQEMGQAGITDVAATISEIGGRLTFTETIQEFAGLNEKVETFEDLLQGANARITAGNVALTGLVATIGVAVDLVEDTYDAAREFREETGVGAERMRELRAVTRDVSTELAGFGLPPGATTDITLSLREQFGAVETATRLSGENLETLVTQSGALAEAIGVSGGRAGELVGQFIELERLIGGSAQGAMATAVNLAEAEDVAPQAVMEQVAENAEQLAQFSGNTVQSLTRAAVEAQKLGTNLGSVAEFQEQSLNNITGQIQQLQEAQMLTGQQFESTQLLQASYQGTEETLTEVREQLEGINFEQMNFFQRQALEEAFPGFSIQELERMSEAEQLLNEIDGDVQEIGEQVAEGRISVTRAITAGRVDEFENLRQQLNRLYFILAENVAPVLTELIEGVLPALTGVLEILEPLLRGVGLGVRLILSPLEILSELMQGDLESALDTVLGPFRRLGRFFGIIDEEGEKAEETIGLVEGALVSLGTVIGAYFGAGGAARLGNILAGWIPGLSRVGALIQGVGSRLIILGRSIGGMLPAVGSLSGAFSSLAGILGVSTGGLGFIIAGVVVAIGGAIAVFYNWEEVVQSVTEAFDSFMSTVFGVENATEEVSSAVSTAGEWFSWFGSVAEAIGPTLGLPFMLLTDRVSDALSLTGSIIDAFGTVVEWFQSGEWSELDDVILEVFSGIGQEIIDFVVPDSIQGQIVSLFSGVDDMIMNTLSGVGESVLQMILPDGVGMEVAMTSMTETIKSFLPFSPAEVGPLSTLDEVNIGGEIAANIDTEQVQAKMEDIGATVRNVAETVLPSPVVEGATDVVSAIYNTFTGGGEEAAEPQVDVARQEMASMSAQTVTIQTDAIRAQAEMGQFAQPQVRQEAGAMAVEEQAAGEEGGEISVQPAAQQPEMNVQPAQTEVATIDQQAVQAQPAAEPEQEIRVDSDTTSMEDLLRQIRNSQQQLIRELREGNIAVYLDGRKVNKEMVRNLDVTE